MAKEIRAKDKIAAEKSDVARMVASLEVDLKRVRRDAELLARISNFFGWGMTS